MRLFDRYIIQRILIGTFFGVFCLSAVLLMGQLFKDLKPLLASQQAPLLQVFKFIVSTIPFMLMFTLPWAFLTAVVLAFGKLSSTNELVGMRMAGWGVWRIAVPVAVLGALLSTLCFWLNSTVAPQAKSNLQTLVYESLKDDPQAFLNPGTTQKQLGDGSRLFVEDKDGKTLKGFHFYQLSPQERFPVSYIFAKEVGVAVSEDKQKLELSLRQAYFESLGESSPFIIADQAQPWLIKLPNQGGKKSLGAMTNSEIRKQTAEMGDQLSKKDKLKRVKEIAKRQSLALACFCFGIIGVPLGVQSRRKENNRGFLLALIVAGGYFGILMGVEGVGDTAIVRQVALWMPNIICLVVAFFFYRKVNFS